MLMIMMRRRRRRQRDHHYEDDDDNEEDGDDAWKKLHPTEAARTQCNNHVIASSQGVETG